VNIGEIKKRLAGGQEFSIPHPEFGRVGNYTIAVAGKDGLISNLDPLHIVSARNMSRRNGHS